MKNVGHRALGQPGDTQAGAAQALQPEGNKEWESGRWGVSVEVKW